MSIQRTPIPRSFEELQFLQFCEQRDHYLVRSWHPQYFAELLRLRRAHALERLDALQRIMRETLR